MPKKAQKKQPSKKPATVGDVVDPGRLLTSHEAGWYLQVNPSSINKWVKEGRIKAFRTPGGHRRITVADLIAFLEEHKMPVPETLTSGKAPERRP